MRFVIAIIIFYKRFISPFKPPCCRFVPTCSTYTLDAVKKWGLWKGAGLSLKRFLRCNPMNPGGYDPVD